MCFDKLVEAESKVLVLEFPRSFLSMVSFRGLNLIW